MNHKVHETKVDLKSYQMHKLNELLVFVSGFNEFYKEKFQGIQLPITSRHDLASLPFITKKELAEDQKCIHHMVVIILIQRLAILDIIKHQEQLAVL